MDQLADTPLLPALLQRIIEHACEAAGADSAAMMRVEGAEGVAGSRFLLTLPAA